MRASLNKLKDTEDFLKGSLKPQNALLFRAKLLLDPLLRMNVSLQKKTYSIVKSYGRKSVIQEIDTIQQKIFSDPYRTNFHREIDQLFPKQ